MGTWHQAGRLGSAKVRLAKIRLTTDHVSGLEDIHVAIEEAAEALSEANDVMFSERIGLAEEILMLLEAEPCEA
jgi:hypothetical protein